MPRVKSLATIYSSKDISVDTTGDGKVRLKCGPWRVRLSPATIASMAKKVAEADAKGTLKKAQAEAKAAIAAKGKKGVNVRRASKPQA